MAISEAANAIDSDIYLNIVDNTEFSINSSDADTNRAVQAIIKQCGNQVYGLAIGEAADAINSDIYLNIVDNTELTINSSDVNTNRAVQAIINNAAINSTD